MTAAQVRKALRELATPARARSSAWFFKTGPGQYGEGDVFIGVSVPQMRVVARRFSGMPLAEVLKLLKSKVHEERLTALIMLVRLYHKGDEKVKAAAAKAYLANLKWVNNWDLVDSSAPQLLGHWLKDKDRRPLYKLAGSRVLWERRVAMVTTQHYINAGEAKDALAIAQRLLKDDQDLMHKAVGWMLREVGKKVDAELLRGFLKKNAARMPRTALRYAIEHFKGNERRYWMSQKAV